MYALIQQQINSFKTMKFNSILFAIAALLVLAACQPQGSSRQAKLATNADSASYAIGLLVGDQNKQQLEASGADELDYSILVTAFEEQLNGAEAQMTTEEAQTFIRTYFQQLAEAEGEKNKQEGEAFLAKNKEKEGVEVTESGLQYEVITEGTGAKPTADQKVKVHYTGTLLDGTVFDSSVERGEPTTFGVGQVIPGWTEALQLMPVGSKWKVYIPGDLAYGPRGAGADIGPNSTLIFEVELLEIVE
ncbi:FKBP-type peptidyl-prolyl cis-trans isomerase FkpA/FKBP-type peptidyl-prolyl cis-trans isomerase FklB [Sunxiuqinia elliptica]|uniref:Peptidyl-prolyl cis-trans isomerase n=2 Tax=Sunxiuqinia elliptica TaxID=655355 RepID=A0A1I2I1F9_9BACT|nr:FKBP-type peptidyl-prolyl cis-trans isomerase FkpA/FKBP-type peptidyl-prolyl cis-trans isomerase FklB [Sunxiuqinia elliptica]